MLRRDRLGVTKLTNINMKVKTPSERLATVFQIKATEDFEVLVFNGIDYQKEKIHKGELGGFVEKGVILGDNSWLHSDSIIFGNTRFEGVTCGYARIEDSTVNKGTIIGGRTIIVDSSIGEDATIYGTNKIKGSKIHDEAKIVEAIIRQSVITKGAVVKCAGTIKNETVQGFKTRS